MPGSTFLDTNVLVYSVDSRDRAKQQTALRLLADSSEMYVVSGQVLAEFYVTATRGLPRPLTHDAAAARVDELSELPVVPIDDTIVRAAISLTETARISYWDAAIIAAASVAGCRRVLTGDMHDGAEIAGVRVENPFK